MKVARVVTLPAGRNRSRCHRHNGTPQRDWPPNRRQHALLHATIYLPANLGLHAFRTRQSVEHCAFKTEPRKREAYPAHEPLRSGSELAGPSLSILVLLRPLDRSKYQIRLTQV